MYAVDVSVMCLYAFLQEEENVRVFLYKMLLVKGLVVPRKKR
jgi:hypothetical protein